MIAYNSPARETGTSSSQHTFHSRLCLPTWPRRLKSWIADQGSTVRGCGGDSSGTFGVSCMNGAYLSQSTCQRARRRERSASFGSKPLGAVACFGVAAGLPRHRHSLADAPLAANGPPGVGVRFPVARRRRDHLSEGSCRREAPCSTWRPRCKVSRPRPARDLHRTPHLPAHSPRARSRAPAFTTSPPSPP